jgi:cobalt-zinc-cadmium efflux system protein
MGYLPCSGTQTSRREGRVSRHSFHSYADSDVADQGPIHDHFHGTEQDRKAQRRKMRWVLGLTAAFMVAEVVGGIISNSLALLADAGHMFTDVGALALSLVAMRLAQKPPSPTKTYGYVRLEILAALINGAALLFISGFILLEAWKRAHTPPDVDGPLMLTVAAVGLFVNLLGAWLLHSHANESLNVRGAYLHILGDILGSVGAIVAGLLIMATGWMLADPIISVIIALLILVSAWRLVREATDVLLEGAPRDLDVEELVEELRGIDGLEELHDVHVWTLTSGFVAMSGHGVIDDLDVHRRVLDDINAKLNARGISHVTFQLEPRPLHQIREGGEGE